MAATLMYEDRFGSVIDRPDDGYIEIRWYDASVDFDGASFNEWLSTFATCVETSGQTKSLVDATQFRMDMSLMSMGWRDENIIPRYNAAGMTKFAFLMPEGMPAIGAAPVVEGPASFPTAYFGSRAAALAWLAEA